MAALETVYLRDSNAAVVKLEPPEIDIEAVREKIGDIYRTSPDRLALVCAHCDAEFSLFSQFTVHIQLHLHRIQPNLTNNHISDGIQLNMLGVAAEKHIKIEQSCDISMASCDSEFDWPDDEPEAEPEALEPDATLAPNAASLSTNYDCHQCGVHFTTRQMLFRHQKTHAEHSISGSSITCAICSKTYSKYAYRNHLAVHRNADKLFCSPCKRQFGTASNFSRHLKRVHRYVAGDNNDAHDRQSQRTYECFACHRNFDKIGKCRTHRCSRNSDIDKTRLECPHCTRSYNTNQLRIYLSHVRSHRRLTCTICQKSYAKNAYHAHMARHTKADQLVCPPCNKAFSNRSNLQRHLKKMHATESTNADAQRKIECYRCHRPMNGLIECRAHVNSHCDNKPDILSEKKDFNDTRTDLACQEIVEEPRSAAANARLVPAASTPSTAVVVYEEAKIAGFCCSQCNKNFKDAAKLERHLEEHAGVERAYKCLLCQRSFDVYKQYYNHVQNHKKITCSICDKTYTKSAYHNHMVGHRRAEKLFCSQCNRSFSTTSNFRRHLKNVHEVDATENASDANVPMKPMYECAQCRRSFGTEKKYLVHLQSHEQYRECTICNRTYAKAAYYNHMARHTSGIQLFCSPCDRQFGTISNFKRHSRQVHGTTDEQSAAAVPRDGLEVGDEAKTAGATALVDGVSRQRQRQHSTARCTVHCELCHEQFSSKTHLSRHMVQRHAASPNPKQQGQVTCELCDRPIAKEQIKQHMQRHRSAQVFQCESCDAQFIYQHLLTRHRRIHSTERKYLCEFCPMAFKETSHLELHRRRHTGEFLFTCPWCSRGYLEKRALRNHALGVHQMAWNG